LVVLNLEFLVSADEVLVFVSNQSSGEEVRLNEHLEAVADAQHRQALLGLLDYLFGCWGFGCDCSAAEVVAIGEASGEDDRVYSFEIIVCVPEGDWRAAS
jgi:hypothetical protein